MLLRDHLPPPTHTSVYCSATSASSDDDPNGLDGLDPTDGPDPLLAWQAVCICPILSVHLAFVLFKLRHLLLSICKRTLVARGGGLRHLAELCPDVHEARVGVHHLHTEGHTHARTRTARVSVQSRAGLALAW